MLYILFKCKYICEYKRLFIQIYLSSMLRKILFFMPHLFYNVEFEFSWFYNTKQLSEILILKIEMLLEFQNEVNIIINASWIHLELSDIDMWDIDLWDRDLDFLDTDISSKHFVYLQDVFKTCLQDVFKTSSA